MANFADWTTLTYVNDTTPAINATNLNKNENALEDVMNELNYSKGFSFDYVKKHAFDNNTVILDNCENWVNEPADYTLIGTATLTEEFNLAFGKSGAKFTINSNTGEFVGADRDISSTDVSFENVLITDDDESIVIMVYLSDATYFSGNIAIRIGISTSYYYYEDTIATLEDGWNLITFLKSDTLETNSPSWENVDYLRVTLETENNASGVYFTLGTILLTRQDETSLITNPFYYTSGTDIYDESYMLSPDLTSIVTYDTSSIHQIGMQLLQDTTFPDMNEILCTVNSFYFKGEAYCKVASYGMAIQWYQDSDNYLAIGIDSDALYIYENVGGSGSLADITSVTLGYNVRHELEVEKVENLLRVKLVIDGDGIYYMDYETTISSGTSGCVGFTKTDKNAYYLVTDFVISHNRAICPLYKFGKINKIIKFNDDIITSDTTLSDDTELTINLRPNSLYFVELVLSIDSISDIVDVKVTWTYTGMTSEIYKNIRGRGTNSTSSDNSEYMNTQTVGATTTTNYGVDTNGYSYIRETCIMRTSDTGGILTIQHAQLNSSSDYISIKNNSYLKATKID